MSLKKKWGFWRKVFPLSHELGLDTQLAYIQLRDQGFIMREVDYFSVLNGNPR